MAGKVLFKKPRREIVRFIWLMVGARKRSRLISLAACFDQHFDPYADVVTVVVVSAPADQIAVHNAWLVHESPAAHLKVEFAFGHSRHLPALHASGVSGYLHAVTYAGDGFVGLEKVPCDTDEIFVVAYVLRSATAREKYTQIFLWLDILKSNIRLQRVALEFPRYLPVPVGRNLVHDHVVSPLLGPGHDRLKTVFLQTIVRIQRIDRLGGVANYN